MWKSLAVAAVAAVLMLAGCGGGETAAKSTNSTASSTPAPVVAAAPAVIPFPIAFAESKGITVVPTDIGPQIVDGVTEVRAVNGTDWRIVAQCDRMTNNQLVAGVIKPEEFTTISQAGQGAKIADNSFKRLLTCP